MSSDWAKQETLDKIAAATRSSADSLTTMLKGTDLGLGAFRDGLKKSGDAAEQNAGKSRSFGKAINDITQSLFKHRDDMSKKEREALDTRIKRYQFWENQTRSALTNSQQNLSAVTEKISRGLNVIPLVGPVVGGALGVISGFIQSVMGVRDSFINMVDSGIMFRGSLVDFRVSMGNAGITAEQFASIAAQSGQAMQIFGERRFLDSTGRLRRLFDELGVNLAQGNEYFAEYLENSRLSGTLYFQSQDQQREGFEVNLRQMREQARLTGISVRQQRDQQRALQQETEYQLLLRSVSPERAAYIRQQEAGITTVAGAEFAKEFATYAERGILRQGGFMASAQTLGLGEELNRLAQRFRQGEQIDPTELQAAIMRVPRELISTLQARSMSGDRMSQQFMQMRLAAEARQGIPGARGTEAGLDQPTQAMITAQNNLNLALAQFNATMVEIGAKALPYVLPGLESFNRVLQSITTAQPGQGITALLQALGVGEGTLNILRTFQTEGPMAAARASLDLITGGFFTRLGDSIDDLITKLGTWRDEFITALGNLPILRWFNRDAAPMPENPVVMAPTDSRARALGTGANQIPNREIWTAVPSILDSVYTALDNRNTLSNEQTNLLNQNLQRLQQLQTAIEQQPVRSGAETELLEVIARAITDGNRRVERAIQQSD